MSDKNDVVIVSAVRTAIGGFMGSLKDVTAARLGSIVIAEALNRAKVAPADVTEVLMGQVLTAAVGQNPARQASMGAGVPKEVPAMTINRVCGSGLQTVALAAQAIKAEGSGIYVAGGQENMSQSPHAMRMREGLKMGEGKLVDTMIVDGLWDCFNDYHMGITAENVAKQLGISREEQDAFAFESQRKTDIALKSNVFSDEIVPVEIPQKKGEPLVFRIDENPRLSAIDVLAKLRPAFDKAGTVTAGNASAINDGAAAVVVMTRGEAERRNLPVLAKIVSHAVAGVDPAVMGFAPIDATKQALGKAGWRVDDLDLIESNEAFAAQALAVVKTLNLPENKVNVNGGAIALGHPIGASGCRVLVTLLHEMQRKNAKKGLATLCIGGGQGIAMCVER